MTAARASFRASVASVLRLAGAPRWSAPAIVGLGLVAALFEGVGLTLFIPLIEVLGGNSGNSSGVAALLNRLIEPVPAHLRVAALIGGLCASILLKNMVAQLNTFVTQHVNQWVTHRLRVRVMRQTLDSCIDYRIESRRSDIVTTIANNTWSVGEALARVHRMVVCVCALGVFIVLLMLVSPALTALAVGLFAAIAAIVGYATRHAHQVGQQVVAENRAFGMRMWENVLGLKLIRACCREALEMARFEQVSDIVRRRLAQMTMLWSMPGPMTEVLSTFAIAALILAGNSLALGIASLAAFLALLYRMQGPLRELLSLRVGFEVAAAAVADVADFLERTREPYLRDGSVGFRHLERGLSLREVGYRYAPGESMALNGVSFELPRGQMTAIVGRSGAGKSTLMDLLFRFRDPTAGEIRVDGIPLTHLTIASWRARIALMAQEVHLFNDTVAANIGYGRVGASDDDIRRAAAVAGASSFIDALPAGYDTLLGDAGARLSGGQRQRIALARTILRDPDILLLDEATNALDNETDREFQRALRHFARGRTLVVIAHRLSTVEDADLVVVIEGGRVIEVGPPSALLSAKGAFARMHGLQTAPADASVVA